MSPTNKSLIAILLSGSLLTMLLVANLPESDNQNSDIALSAAKQISEQLGDQIDAVSSGLNKLANNSFWQNAPAADWSQRINTQTEIYQAAGITFLGSHYRSSDYIYLEHRNQARNSSELDSILSKVYRTIKPIQLLGNYRNKPAIMIVQPVKTVENKVIGSLIGVKLIDEQLLKEFHYTAKFPAVILKNSSIDSFSSEDAPELSNFNLVTVKWPENTPSVNWELALLVKKQALFSSAFIWFFLGLIITLVTVIFVWQQIVKIQNSLKHVIKILDLELPIAEQIKVLSNLQSTNIDPSLRECSQAVKARFEQLSHQKKSLSQEIRKLHETENDLRRAQNNMSQELNSAIAAPRLKSEFLSRMGDEITTPMKSVVSMLKLLSEYSFDPEPKQLLTIAKRSTRLLVNNLNNILDFSKLDAHMLRLRPLSFNVRELVDGLSSELAHFASEKDLSLQASCSPEIPTTVIADDYRIKQIIRNLLGNAIRFTKDGEVSLFADTTIKGDDKFLRFTIADTGIGISPAAQKDVFDSLEQSTKLNNSSFAGRLRLIVSKMLAELLGGEIGLNSELGQGSQFWFTVKYKEE